MEAPSSHPDETGSGSSESWDEQNVAESFRTLERLSWKVHSNRDPRVVLDEVVQTVIDLTPYDLCWIGLWDADLDEPRALHAYCGFLSDYSATHFVEWPLAESPSGSASQSRYPIAIADVQRDNRFPKLQADGALRGYQSVLVIPFRIGAEHGAMWVGYRTPHPFSEEEIAFATVATSLAAIALRNARDAGRDKELQETQRVQLAELARLNKLAAAHNVLLERLSQVHQSLIEEIIGQRGMDSLVNRASAFLRAQIVVVDRAGETISASAGDYVDIAAVNMELFNPDQNPRRFLDVQKGFIGNRPYLSSRVLSGNSQLGMVFAIRGDGTEFAEDDPLVLGHTAVMLALEMLKARIRLEAEIHSSRNFASALTNPEAPISAIRRQSHLLGLDLTTPTRCVLVRIHDAPDRSEITDEVPFLAMARARVAESEPGSVLISAGGLDMVVVVPWANNSGTKDEKQLYLNLRRAIEAALRVFGGPQWASVKITAGLGGTELGAEGLRQSFLDATRALAVLEATGRTGTHLSLRDAGSFAVFTATSDGDQDRFIQRHLGPLLSYDEDNGSGFIQTLIAYFGFNGSIQKTADQLFIHVTTVRYRLQKIEGLADVSLKDDEDRLCLEIALRMLQLRAAP